MNSYTFLRGVLSGPAGDAEAQYRLGMIFAKGEGVFKDAAQAAAWFRKAAEQGHPEAQFELAEMYAGDYGIGEPSVAMQAEIWYLKSAAQDHADAQFKLLEIYSRKAKHARQMEEQYRIFAGQGDATAQNILAEIYEREAVYAEIEEEYYRSPLERIHFDSKLKLVKMFARQVEKLYLKAGEMGQAETQSILADMYAREAEYARQGEAQARKPREPYGFVDYFMAEFYQIEVCNASAAEERFRIPAEKVGALGKFNATEWEAKEIEYVKNISEFLSALEPLTETDINELFKPEHDAEKCRNAAEQGCAQAQCNLGRLYATGDGVPKDAIQATVWYLKAAEQGYAEAQYNLGRLYATGDGMPKDAIQAVLWYLKAAEQGYAEAQYNLGRLYATGDGVAKDAILAVEWYQKAAEKDYAEAKYSLGVWYSSGSDAPKDPIRGLVWYLKAAEQGYAEAQYNLGRLYATGDGVAKDAIQAVEWYRKAAEQGHASAQYNLGLMFAKGEGVPKNSVFAYAWWDLAVAKGDESARINRDIIKKEMTSAQIDQAHRMSVNWRRGKKFSNRALH